jgi:inosose dehydratase
MKVSIAGAPVSFGVFELTPEGAATISPDEMLEILAQTGYEGVDLGPLGYFGEGNVLTERLRRFGLALAGGWVQLPFSDDAAFEASLPSLDHALRVFEQAAELKPARLPLPTLADGGSALRQAHPGHGARIDALDEAAWKRLCANANRAAAIVRARGFEPTFHHHAGTYVESPEEIDRFLADVDIGLTLDTGHLLIGNGDPVEAMRRWGRRINHLHLKDVDIRELKQVLHAGGGMREVWSSGAFTAFGKGSIDLHAVVGAAAASDYNGWIVVEQDVLNRPDIALDDFRVQRAADQLANREALRHWV